MKIYDMIIYDEIDIYTRDDVTQGSWTSAQQRLMKWFKDVMTDDIFLELINTKEIKNQNGKVAKGERLERFKEFMSNYYIDSPNITKKSFYILVDYAVKTDEFRYKTDTILGSTFVTEEIFNIALDAGYLGMDNKKWHAVFTNNQYSDKTLLKYIELTKKDHPWLQMIKNQKLSDKVIKAILDSTNNNLDIIYELTKHNHKVDNRLFIDSLDKVDLDGFDTLLTLRDIFIALKKMIVQDRNVFEEPYNWNKIQNFVFKKQKPSYDLLGLLFMAILTHENINTNVLDTLFDYSSVFKAMPETFDVSKLPESNKIMIFDKFGLEEYLSHELKELFIF